jgi:tetratricopeptide (TPR) repeat protein
MSRYHRKTELPPSGYWTSTQSYVLATVTLVVGLLVGYLIRGSESTPTDLANSALAGSGLSASESLTQPKAPPELTARVVAPLLNELKARPKDSQLLNKIGNTYYDNQEYPKAIDYYEKSLAIKPDDADVRTDMGTAIWYTGDADRALKEYERSLSYQPNHPNTLFNMGIVKWHGKKDTKGALEAWNQLLTTNPNYPERQRVLQLIQQLQSGGA